MNRFSQTTPHRLSAIIMLATIVLFLFPAAAAAQDFGSMRHFDVKDGLSTNYINDITQDKRGFIWLATDAGLNRFDGRKFRAFPLSLCGFPSNTVTSLHYDEEADCLWVGTRSGLGKFDCATHTFTSMKFPDGVYTGNISKILPAAGGGIWIVARYHNIIRLGKDNKATVYSPRKMKNMPTTFLSAADDGKGHLIIGSSEGTVASLNYNTGKSDAYFKNVQDGAFNDVLVDSRSNIWLAGNHGLTLYLPSKQTFHTVSDFRGKPAAASERIYSLSETSGGKIIAGGDLGYFSIFDPEEITLGNLDNLTFSTHNVRENLRDITSGNILQAFEDSFGNIWLCNYGKGLDVVCRKSPVFSLFPLFESKCLGFLNSDIWSVCAASGGAVWLGGTNSVGIFRDNSLTETVDFSALLPQKHARVISLGETSSGEMLIGLAEEGLLRHDFRTGTTSRIETPVADMSISSFLVDGDGSVLIGASNGIWRLRDGKISPENKMNSDIAYLSAVSLCKDRNNNLWVATYGDGIFIFDKELNLRDHLDADFLKGGAARQILADSRGRIWIATKEFVGIVEDPSKPKEIRLSDSFPDSAPTLVRGLAEDRNGRVWVSTDTGIFQWDSDRGAVQGFRESESVTLSNFNNRACAADASGNIIYGSSSGAICFNPGRLGEIGKAAQVRIIECRSVDPADGTEEHILPARDNSISLTYDDASLAISFAVPDVSQSGMVEYAVMLEGFDHGWNTPTDEKLVAYRNLPPGNYRFKVRARMPNQEWDDINIASMGISVAPPLWGTWYAKLFYLAAAVALLWLWMRHYSRKVTIKGNTEVAREKDINEKELNDERLRFYTNITHELRTPLTLILGPLEDLISDEHLQESYRNRIKVIHASAMRLLNLVNQILEFRKTETQNRRLCVSKGNLGDYVTEIGLRFKELNRNAGVDIRIDAAGKGAGIYFDPDVVTTVISNLLSNAVKYTPEGEIALTVDETETNGTRYARITVADTGYGIDPKALPFIFDRYYQAKGKHQASGTGIGLALVKSLAELHGALLHVESRQGEGTVFRFSLLADCTYPDALHSEPENRPAAGEDTRYPDKEEQKDSRPCVLIVEDNFDIREYVAGSLSDEYRVLLGSDGKEGLELAIANNPDIIISDIMMPVMDGLEMLRELKADVRTSHIPVVLLTAKDSLRDKEVGYDCGADSYLTKPFSAKLLRSRILNILSARSKLATIIEMKASGSTPGGMAKAAQAVPEAASRLGKFDQIFIDKFTAVVEDNLTLPGLDMAFVQDKMNMSHSTLYRKIKGITGLSGNEFIRKVKLRHALAMLMEGSSVADAAYESGFNDAAYFRSCFKEEYGDSPSVYVKKNRPPSTLKV